VVLAAEAMLVDQVLEDPLRRQTLLDLRLDGLAKWLAEAA